MTHELLLGTKRLIGVLFWGIVINIQAEYVLELIKGEHAIPSDVVLFNHLIYFYFVDVFAELLHGQANVFFRNFA